MKKICLSAAAGGILLFSGLFIGTAALAIDQQQEVVVNPQIEAKIEAVTFDKIKPDLDKAIQEGSAKKVEDIISKSDIGLNREIVYYLENGSGAGGRAVFKQILSDKSTASVIQSALLTHSTNSSASIAGVAAIGTVSGAGTVATTGAAAPSNPTLSETSAVGATVNAVQVQSQSTNQPATSYLPSNNFSNNAVAPDDEPTNPLVTTLPMGPMGGGNLTSPSDPAPNGGVYTSTNVGSPVNPPTYYCKGGGSCTNPIISQ